MRSCEDFERLLPAYVAGVAEPADVAEIGEHIADCSPCMNDFQRVVKELATLKSWRDPQPPEGLAARVLERLVTAEADRKREALGEETSWGEPMQRGLTWAVLGLACVIVLACLITASAGISYEDKRRSCASNLNHLGQLAAAKNRLAAPMDTFMEQNRSELEEKNKHALVCPVAGKLPEAAGRTPDEQPWHSYMTHLPGPKYLAGDYRENHKYSDANILMSDGRVIMVTPAQATLWDQLNQR